MDLASWNISIFPADLYQIWSDVAPVQLVSHSPIASIKDDPYFKDWVFIGQCPAYIRVAPEFKQPLFLYLQDDAEYQIFLSDFPTAFIRGSQTVLFSTLISALQEIGCTAVRVQAYGMKYYLPPQELHLLPMGNLQHPLAKHNTFDLGINYGSNNIALVHPRYRTAGTQVYPMLLPIGKGFGSVHMDLTLDDQPFLVKAYPRVVHSIKSLAGNQFFTKPSSVFTLKKRQHTCKKYIHPLNSLQPSQLGGLRLEVTVTAPTLMEAIRVVNSTPLLDISNYLAPPSEIMKPYKLVQKQITKEEYIRNCQALLATAEAMNIFTGNVNLPASAISKQIVVDLFNSIGWNNGRKRPTQYNRADAWWSSEEAEDGAITVLVPTTSMNHITGVQPMTDFFVARRLQLPCHNCQHPPPTYILCGGKRQFKIKCTACHSILTQQKARDYFSTLLADGTIAFSEEDAPPRPASPLPAPQPVRPLAALPAPVPPSDEEEEDEDAPPRMTRRRRAVQAAVQAAAKRRSTRISKQRLQGPPRVGLPTKHPLFYAS